MADAITNPPLDVAATLRQASQRRRKLSRLKRILLGVLIAVLVGSLAVWVGHGLFTGHWGKFPFKAFNMLNWVNLIGYAVTVKSQEREALRSAAQLDDVTLVGPLTEALEFTERRRNKETPAREIAEEALVRLLPRVQSSDSHLLDEPQRQILYRALEGKNHELTLAILTALSQVGGESAIAPVSKLTSSPLPSLRDSAVQCLHSVSERAEQERMASVLLRPSHGGEAMHLLRPAGTGSPEADPALLLRAVSEETSHA